MSDQTKVTLTVKQYNDALSAAEARGIKRASVKAAMSGLTIAPDAEAEGAVLALVEIATDVYENMLGPEVPELQVALARFVVEADAEGEEA